MDGQKVCIFNNDSSGTKVSLFFSSKFFYAKVLWRKTIVDIFNQNFFFVVYELFLLPRNAAISEYLYGARDDAVSR